MRGVVVLMIFGGLLASRAIGQVSVEEAQRRLEERRSQRAGELKPATRSVLPATSQAVAAEFGAALHEAWAKLIGKQYAEASAVFDRVLAKDARHPIALQGRAICNYELSKDKAALEDAEKAFLMGKTNPAMSRQFAMVAAVANIAANNPFRAVKIALDVLKSEDTGGIADEELQNVLGTAIWRCKSDTRGLPLMKEAGRFYLQYDEKLSEKRPGNQAPKYFGYDLKQVPPKNFGQRRWGTQWLAADDAYARWQVFAATVEERDVAVVNLARATTDIARAQDNYDRVIRRPDGAPLVEIDQAVQIVKLATLNESVARDALKAAEGNLAAVEKPPFPLKVEPTWTEPTAEPVARR